MPRPNPGGFKAGTDDMEALLAGGALGPQPFSDLGLRRPFFLRREIEADGRL